MVSWLRPVAFTTSFICMDLTLELTPRLRYLPLRYLSSSRNNNEHRIYCRRRLCVKRPDYCGSEAESSGVVKPRHEIGRASCRERVWMAVVGGAFRTTTRRG